MKNPKIIHFQEESKPWNNPDEEYADVWWEYARKTPFYEECLKRMCQIKPKELSELFNYKKNVLKYWKYKLFSNFSLGRSKERYLSKRFMYKQKINNAKKMIKG